MGICLRRNAIHRVSHRPDGLGGAAFLPPLLRHSFHVAGRAAVWAAGMPPLLRLPRRRQFSKKLRQALGREIERTGAFFPARGRNGAGSVKIFYAFAHKTGCGRAAACHGCPLPRSRLLALGPKGGGARGLRRYGSGQMVARMAATLGKTGAKGRKMQAWVGRQHGPDRRRHGMLLHFHGHDWPKGAADGQNGPFGTKIGGRSVPRNAQPRRGRRRPAARASTALKNPHAAPPRTLRGSRRYVGKKT